VSVNSPEVETPRLAYSPSEVAVAIGVCRATVYNLMASGVLPSVKVGRSRRIRVADLHDYIDGLNDPGPVAS